MDRPASEHLGAYRAGRQVTFPGWAAQGLQAMPFSSLLTKGLNLAGPGFPKVSKARECHQGVRANPAMASSIHCVHEPKGPETRPDLETEQHDCLKKQVSEQKDLTGTQMATGWFAPALAQHQNPLPSSFHLELNHREARPGAREMPQRTPTGSLPGFCSQLVHSVFYTHFGIHYIWRILCPLQCSIGIVEAWKDRI